MDKKMEMFTSNEYWQEAIDKAVDKQIDKGLLSMLANPVGRNAICQAIYDGRYVIQPPTIREVPKPNGKVREVYVNQPMDRVVLSIINNIYIDLYGHMIHPNCLSYKKTLGVNKIMRQIITELKNGGTGYKADLTKYFDSVNKETLFTTLDKLSTDSPIDKVVRDYYTDDRVIINGNEVERYKSIAQGCSIGCTLANIILEDIDTVISQLDVVYYRYSDDLLVIGKDADLALEIITEMLKPKGLTLNPAKVERIDSTKSFTFLGMKIVNGTEISFGEKTIKTFQKEIRKRTIDLIGQKQHDGTRLLRMNRNQLNKAIKNINSYLYTSFAKNSNNFGWGQYFLGTVTVEDDIKTMDTYIKDCLRACYTGKIKVGYLGSSNKVERSPGQNVKANYNKTHTNDYDLIKDLGMYRSMLYMWKAKRTNAELFNSEVRLIQNGMKISL